ncbi:hypothetical protein L686_08575 [Stutzerimonas stutzeri MF28]|nr:hypothetical protein L686_08575 [Stutzerimonas stutzeri MF28]
MASSLRAGVDAVERHLKKLEEDGDVLEVEKTREHVAILKRMAREAEIEERRRNIRLVPNNHVEAECATVPGQLSPRPAGGDCHLVQD